MSARRSPTGDRSGNDGSTQRTRSDIRPRKGRIFEFDAEKVLEVCAHHKEFKDHGTTLKGLAKFDDSRGYGLDDDLETKLVKIEVDRLIAAVSAEGPFLFNSDGLFQGTEESTFEELSHVADQIRVNFEIIRHDNAMHALRHCPDLLDNAVDGFRQARTRLSSRYKHDELHVEGSEPKMLQPLERNLQAYFALVDYVTASIGRLLFRVVTSKYWETHLLSILAQWAAKLKVLSHKPAHYAAQSLDHGEQFVVELIAGMESRSVVLLKIRKAADAAEHKDVDALNQETTITSRYYKQKKQFRDNVERLLKNTLDTLLHREDNGSAVAAFEMCTLVFQTGLDGVPTTLSNSREGIISASSGAVRVNCTYTALNLLMQNVREIAKAPRKCGEGHGATVKWEWVHDTDKNANGAAEIEIAEMDMIISILAPLGLTSTYSSVRLEELMSLISNLVDEDDPIVQFAPPPRGFEASFTFTTSQHVDKLNNPTVSRHRDPDVCSVSASSTRLGIKARERMYSQTFRKASKSEDNREKMIAAYENDKAKMNGWDISEDSITIHCRRYVIAVIILAVVLLLIGMSVPFIVGERIKGVDPFQITTFSWIIAGFVVLVAKAQYVNTWLWHDFLQGRVVCRSVSDVCAVTRIDPQLVLMNLLHEERENTLTTRGPFNGMFSRKSENSGVGFAIDESVRLVTMLASGFVILKVVNEMGEHLLCVDVRKGVEGVGTLKNSYEKSLACMDIGRDELQDAMNDRSLDVRKKAWSSFKRFARTRPDKVMRLAESELTYNKVLGLYIKNSKFG
ncbi:hypothetical protein ACLMJK_003206 [Lecanora helva]